MERIKEYLSRREADGLLRALHRPVYKKNGCIRINSKDYIDFSSNDYMGLSSHAGLKEAAKSAIDEFGTGASASRLLSGDMEIYHRLEEETAFFKKKDRALIFNSGYQANVGIISAMCNKGDVIFFDKLSHASLIDGILLSGARCFSFRHNDCGHLEFLLNRERSKYREAFIITETVFSMDGDIAPLEELICLKERYGCKIMVDEAHATGIFGRNGAGMSEETGLSDKIDLVMGTFSKALGSFGAYLACSETVKRYLINTCRSFIYSTALPPSVIAVNLASLRIIKKEHERRESLLKNARYFRDALIKKGFSVTGSSQIVPLILGQNDYALKISEGLKRKGYWALPVRYPTVPINKARIRFSITCFHTINILERLLDDISDLMQF